MKCYFCQGKTKDYGTELFYCRTCQEANNLFAVISFKRSSNSPDVAECAAIQLELKKGLYNFTLFLNEKLISISGPQSKYIMTLPGLTITPANAREKLLTYLLFS